MTTAVISPDLEDLYTWAKDQGNLGIAVMFVRAMDSGRLTETIVTNATKVRTRQCAAQAPAPAEPVIAEPVKDETISTGVNPWPGIYTIEHAEGHSTFRVKVQPKGAKFAPEATLIQVLSGRDNTSDYTTFGFLRDGKVFPFRFALDMPRLLVDARNFLSNPESALVSKNCIRCNRILTTPESIAAGIGPECARKQES